MESVDDELQSRYSAVSARYDALVARYNALVDLRETEPERSLREYMREVDIELQERASGCSLYREEADRLAKELEKSRSNSHTSRLAEERQKSEELTVRITELEAELARLRQQSKISSSPQTAAPDRQGLNAEDAVSPREDSAAKNGPHVSSSASPSFEAVRLTFSSEDDKEGDPCNVESTQKASGVDVVRYIQAFSGLQYVEHESPKIDGKDAPVFVVSNPLDGRMIKFSLKFHDQNKMTYDPIAFDLPAMSASTFVCDGLDFELGSAPVLLREILAHVFEKKPSRTDD